MKQFNWNWLKPTLANIPLVFLGFPASYGVAMFEQTVYPNPVNWIMAGAFESCYLGAIFFTQSKSRKMFFITIFSAALCGVLYNSLHAANIDGLLLNQNVIVRWLLALIHGAPLSAVCLSYAMLMHYGSNAKDQSPAPGPMVVRDEATDNLIEALRLQLHEMQGELVEVRKAIVVNQQSEEVTLAGLVDMPELVSVTSGAADSGSSGGIDHRPELSNNGYSNRAANTTTEFPESEVKEILGRLYAQGDRRIKTPDAMKLIKEIWKGDAS